MELEKYFSTIYNELCLSYPFVSSIILVFVSKPLKSEEIVFVEESLYPSNYF